MSQIEFFLFILLLEIVILILMFISLVIERVTIYILNRNRKKKTQSISIFLSHALQKKTGHPSPLPRPLQHPIFLIEVMSSFDAQHEGKVWEDIKKGLMEKYVLHKIRKWTKSFFWQRRLIAAKGFSLHCHAKDLPAIHRMIDDRILLIQNAASLAAIHQKDLYGVEKVLKKMGKSPSYVRFLIKAAFSKETKAAFTLIENVLKATQAEDTLIAGLDILSTKRMTIHAPMLKKAQSSTHPDLRLAATTLNAHNPQENSESALHKALHDKDKRIRKEACFGLRHFPSSENIHMLCKALNDEDFLVRLEAATSLKAMGRDGMRALEKEAHEKNGHSNHIAQYILNIEK